jgi:glycosyltransferase involved in cell wall biosynthesis
MTEKIWIIIPVYKRTSQFLSVVNQAKKYGQVIVIDDCCKQKIFKSELPDCVLLRHVVNRGQGAALQTGVDYALNHGADFFVHLDSDGQHNPADVPKMIAPLLNNQADVVFASRFLNKEKVNIPWTKKWFILKPAIWLHNYWLDCRLTDVHNGFRAMNRRAAKLIKISQDRQAHPTEILRQVIKHDLAYVEADIIVSYNEYGQNIFDGLKIISDILVRWLSD